MEWRQTYYNLSSDGKSETIRCSLYLNFPTSQWNDNKKRPVLKLYYHNYRYSKSWFLDELKTKLYTSYPNKQCEIEFDYFHNHPKIKLYSGKDFSYKKFSLEFCKEKAVKLFIERLNSVINQLNFRTKKFILIEKKQKHPRI